MKEEPGDSDAGFLEHIKDDGKFLREEPEFLEQFRDNLADFLKKVPVARPLKFHSVLSIIKRGTIKEEHFKKEEGVNVLLEEIRS